MKQTRRQRKAQAKRLAASLQQQKNITAQAQRENHRLRRQVELTTVQFNRAIELPSGLLEDLLRTSVNKTVREMTIEMWNTIRDINGFNEAVGEELLSNMIIRTSETPTASIVEDVERGDKHITFNFPAFRWTHVVDRHMLENLKSGRSSPTIMRDGPIYHMDSPYSPARGSQSYMDDVPVKII